jgi:hypothetical protein
VGPQFHLELFVPVIALLVLTVLDVYVIKYVYVIPLQYVLAIELLKLTVVAIKFIETILAEEAIVVAIQ